MFSIIYRFGWCNTDIFFCQRNYCLSNINLSWNGLSHMGAMALADCIKGK